MRTHADSLRSETVCDRLPESDPDLAAVATGEWTRRISLHGCWRPTTARRAGPRRSSWTSTARMTSRMGSRSSAFTTAIIASTCIIRCCYSMARRATGMCATAARQPGGGRPRGGLQTGGGPDAPGSGIRCSDRSRADSGFATPALYEFLGAAVCGGLCPQLPAGGPRLG